MNIGQAIEEIGKGLTIDSYRHRLYVLYSIEADLEEVRKAVKQTFHSPIEDYELESRKVENEGRKDIY